MKWFYPIINGGDLPNIIKKIYDLIPFFSSGKNFAIIFVYFLVAITAAFSLTVLLSLLCDFIKYFFASDLSFIKDFNENIPDKKTVKMYRFIGFGMLCAMLIIMIVFSESEGLWFDEIHWTVGKVINKSFSEITVQLLKDGYNMPLYYYALALIYPLVPYGEVYLLSLSIIFVLIGIIFLYLAAKKNRRGNVGLYNTLHCFSIFNINSSSGLGGSPICILFLLFSFNYVNVLQPHKKGKPKKYPCFLRSNDFITLVPHNI